jgi:hypothetical protein
MSWPSAAAAGCSEVSSTWAGVPALLARSSTHLLLAPHDEHGVVGMAKDRQAVRTHQLERFGLHKARWHPDPGPMALPSEGVS